VEYSSLSLQEVKECEGGCKVKITVGMERDQREDSVFPIEEGMERSCSE
jgi:hypothetical protein